jgi:hypothetical protein
MLIDGVSRKQLQTIAIAALQEGPSLAGVRVYEAADAPTRPELFPMLLVSAPRERKVALYPGMLEFNTTITLVVVGRIHGPFAAPVGEALETFSEQIVNAVFLSPTVNAAVEEYSTVDIQTAVTGDGKTQIGEVGVSFEILVYQSYGPDGPPLTDVLSTVHLDYPANVATPIIFDTNVE